jgi:hypothetical protein
MARSEQCRSRGCLICATALFASAAIFTGSARAGSLAIGPVEQVNLKSSTIVVLGQTYHLGSSTHLTEKATASVVSLGSVTPGTLVAVDGVESAAGSATVHNVILLPQLDVPGATQLLVTGVVSAGSNVGQIRVGGLRVDINATLTSDSQEPAVGQLVQAVGTQPTARGLFLAQRIAAIGGVSANSSAQGIAGTGAATGIAGTGASVGIAGTGAATGIAGTGASVGIAGTGAATGIAGTGASVGIAGTGAATGIAGTGASVGIAGTGAATGIAGTGASVGIAGTGAATGIAGTSLGIAGTGK